LHVRRAANGDHESKIHDIIAAKENQATPQEAFGFHAALTGKRPMKSDRKRENAPIIFEQQLRELAEPGSTEIIMFGRLLSIQMAL